MWKSQELDRIVGALEKEQIIVKVVGWIEFLSYKSKKIEVNVLSFEWLEKLKAAIITVAGKEAIIYKTPITEYMGDEIYFIKIL